jgi:hypothetical protein
MAGRGVAAVDGAITHAAHEERRPRALGDAFGKTLSPGSG